MKQPSFREPDYTFATALLNLRTASGLTQADLGKYLGVSRRTIGVWEAGNFYPKLPHLKALITLAVQHRVFTVERETEEIRNFWQAAHQKVPLNEDWLTKLIATSIVKVQVEPEFAAAPSESASDPDPHREEQGPGVRLDLGNANSVPVFYGRERELEILTTWVIEENCRLVSVVGLGGIGKSALAVTLMHNLSNEFEVVIWRSLRDAEKCENLMDDFIQVVAPQDLDKPFPSLERRISRLLEHMRNHRVLLVLDNLESLLMEGEGAGKMRPDFEGYGQLLRRIAETTHQSCVILTSREKPADLGSFEGNHSPVRTLHLGRLSLKACQQLLADKEVKGSASEQAGLIQAYTGNPLALKIVCQTILEVFDGEIALFLAQGEVIFGQVRELLDQQFHRLSELEQSIMLWLAIMRETTTFEELVAVLVKPIPRAKLLEAVEALRRRSLIERGQKAGSFTLQSVVLEYVTSRLVNEATSDIRQGKLVRLIEHNLVQARAKDYVRQSQERLLVLPLLEALQAQGDFGTGKEVLLDRFNAYFNELRTRDHVSQGYGPANIISLVRWQKGDLSNLDLSGLTLRDIYLPGVQMQNTNLSEAVLQDSIFTETFGSILAMTLSRNGEYLVAINMNSEVVVWKTANFTLNRVWKELRFGINRLALSSDNRSLAVGIPKIGVELWDFNNGTLLRTLFSSGNPSAMYEVAFAPDGKKIAATTDDYFIRIWDKDNGRELYILPQPSEIPTIIWSPNGSLLASGDIKGIIRLWEIPETGPAICVHTLSGHTQEIVGLAFAPDGLTLASASWDGTVRLWDVATGHPGQTLTGHKDRVSRVAWSPDGRFIAMGGRDSDPSIWLWDVERATFRAVLLGHRWVIRGLAFTTDSTNLISCGNDGTVRLWEVASGQPIRVLESYRSTPYALAWAPDGTRLVCSTSNSMVTIYHITASQLPLRLEGNLAPSASVMWSPDGRWIAAGERNNCIRVWDAQTGEFYHLFRQPYRATYDSYDIKWSPDGRFLASGTRSNGVVVWDVQERRQRWVAGPFPAEIFAVDWHPDGIQLAGSGADNKIYIWDARDGSLLRQLSHNFQPFFYNMAWSTDGKWLAAISEDLNDNRILVWDSQTLGPVASISRQNAVFQLLCWDGSGEILISGDNTGTLCWWNVQSGECLRMWVAHHGVITSLARTQDGSRLASCGSDGNIKIWDIKSGELIQTVRQNQPYERLNITGVKGLTEAQKANLRILGAIG